MKNLPIFLLIFLLSSCSEKKEPEVSRNLFSDPIYKAFFKVFDAKLNERLYINKNGEPEKIAGYLITDSTAGKTYIDSTGAYCIPNPDDHTLKSSSISMQNGIKTTYEVIRTLDSNNNTLLEIDKFGIWIYSRKFHTCENIKIGDSPEDFLLNFPDAKCYYLIQGINFKEKEKGKSPFDQNNNEPTEISYQYWLETAKYPQIRFYLSDQTINQEMANNASILEIPLKSLNKNTEIQLIWIKNFGL